jgi:hypothetical protein
MERTKHSFIEFGGHKFSGGFSITHENIHTLEEAIISASIESKINKTESLVDMEIELKDATREIFYEIKKLAPFGIENEKPVFLIRNIIPQKITHFGKAKEHLSVNLFDGKSSIKAISFFTTKVEGVPVTPRFSPSFVFLSTSAAIAGSFRHDANSVALIPSLAASLLNKESPSEDCLAIKTSEYCQNFPCPPIRATHSAAIAAGRALGWICVNGKYFQTHATFPLLSSSASFAVGWNLAQNGHS